MTDKGSLLSIINMYESNENDDNTAANLAFLRMSQSYSRTDSKEKDKENNSEFLNSIEKCLKNLSFLDQNDSKDEIKDNFSSYNINPNNDNITITDFLKCINSDDNKKNISKIEKIQPRFQDKFKDKSEIKNATNSQIKKNDFLNSINNTDFVKNFNLNDTKNNEKIEESYLVQLENLLKGIDDDDDDYYDEKIKDPIAIFEEKEEKDEKEDKSTLKSSKNIESNTAIESQKDINVAKENNNKTAKKKNKKSKHCNLI